MDSCSGPPNHRRRWLVMSAAHYSDGLEPRFLRRIKLHTEMTKARRNPHAIPKKTFPRIR